MAYQNELAHRDRTFQRCRFAMQDEEIVGADFRVLRRL